RSSQIPPPGSHLTTRSIQPPLPTRSHCLNRRQGHFQSRRIAAWPCGSPDEEHALVDREDPAAGAFSVPIESERRLSSFPYHDRALSTCEPGLTRLYAVRGRLSFENGSAPHCLSRKLHAATRR